MEKSNFQKIEQEAKQAEKDEKLKVMDKRNHYKMLLDQQVNQNKELKHMSSMNRHEMALNKNDLHSYFKGDVKINSMIPGLRVTIADASNAVSSRQGQMKKASSNYMSERLSIQGNMD